MSIERTNWATTPNVIVQGVLALQAFIFFGRVTIFHFPSEQCENLHFQSDVFSITIVQHYWKITLGGVFLVSAPRVPQPDIFHDATVCSSSGKHSPCTRACAFEQSLRCPTTTKCTPFSRHRYRSGRSWFSFLVFLSTKVIERRSSRSRVVVRVRSFTAVRVGRFCLFEMYASIKRHDKEIREKRNPGCDR